jgi:prevent-host-death family protein
MDEVSLERARKTLGEIVDHARIAGEHTTITRQGKPGAVMVPVEWYEQAKALIGEEKGQS